MRRSLLPLALLATGCATEAGVTVRGSVSDVVTGVGVGADVCIGEVCTRTQVGAYELEDIPVATNLVIEITDGDYAPVAVPIRTRQEDLEVVEVELVSSLAAGLQYGVLGIEEVPGTGGLAFLVSNGIDGDNLDVIGVTAELDPLAGDGPFYTSDLGIPGTTLDETSAGGGGIFSNLPPGEYQMDFDNLPDECVLLTGWGAAGRPDFPVQASFTTFVSVECPG